MGLILVKGVTHIKGDYLNKQGDPCQNGDFS